MSGHSKWATIKRQKGAADLRRGLTFTKISNAITIAVKEGGARLRLAVEAARENNMPKENIERALRRAQGKLGSKVEEVIYEGFAPFGVSLIIEAVTDNTLRTTSEIKSIFSKEGGNFGQPGSVSYLFEQKGKIVINKDGRTMDELFEAALDAGAEDIKEEEDKAVITTSFSDLSQVRDKILATGIKIIDAFSIRKPLVAMKITDGEQLGRIITFIDKIEELDDVQKVYSNLEE